MRDNSKIKIKRVESRLKELIPEALASMQDNRVNTLGVIDVVCSKGRYDAKVYLDKSYFDEQEQKEVLAQLRKVNGYLQTYIKQSEGWFRSPQFTFEFDEQSEQIAKIENLIKELRKSSDEH